MTDLDLSNISNDPEALNAAFLRLEAGEQPIETEAADPAPEEQTGTAREQVELAAEKEPAQDDGVEPDGVATKDGKNIIPYAVLKSERDRANRANQLATEMQERVAALEKIVQAGSQGAKDGEHARTAESSADDLSQEDLDGLKEDFPTVHKSIMKALNRINTLESKLEPVAKSVKSAAEDHERTVADSVQDAIDSIPKLAHLQANDSESFELAKQFDATLRAQPKWANATLAERFAKVVEMVEASNGSINVPNSGKSSQANAGELRTAALAKAQAAARTNKTVVPTSLSEFPAGEHVAQDENEAASRLSPLQLAEKFASMSSAQMDDYFQKLNNA